MNLEFGIFYLKCGFLDFLGLFEDLMKLGSYRVKYRDVFLIIFLVVV